jgi:hypothetical protein
MTKVNQQGKATKPNKPTWLGKSIWRDKTSLLARKQFSVANEHQKLKCQNDKSITISQLNLTVLRYKG